MTCIHAVLAAISLLAPIAAQRVLAMRSGDRDADRLGAVLRAIGDVNRDGVIDLAAVAPETQSYSWTQGSLRALSGVDLGVLYTIPAPTVGGWFGASVAGIGDVNADGTPDFVVGDPRRNSRGGACEIRSGRDGAVLRVVLGSVVQPENLGGEVSELGDVDADGVPDFAAVANRVLQVRIFSGRTGAVLRTFTGVLSSSDSDRFAMRPAGDIDRDGTADLLFGDPSANTGAGRVTVISGRTGGALRVINGAARGALGSGVAAMSDVDQDGTLDFAASSANEDHPRTSYATGAIRVFSGRNGAVLATIHTPQLPLAHIGHTLAAVGDLNGDGITDLATSSPSSGGGSNGAVRVYAIPSGLLMFEMPGSTGADLGYGLDALGDVNGDGLTDFAVSAPREHTILYEPGTVRVVSGRVVASALAVGTGCGASSQWPTLHATRPLLGTPFRVFGDYAPATPTAMVLVSFAPLRPSSLGLPGCDLFLDPVGMVPFFNVPNAGSWTTSVPLPGAPFLAGIELGLQALFAPTSGPLGADVSNGLRLRLGY